MTKNYLLLISLVASLFAQESAEDDLLSLLQDDMQKYSKIATQTKQNVDYMPYVVSVLNNEELTRLGILSLREALSLVPGVDISIGMAGVKNPIFRGSNPFAMGQSKLIIDGVMVNDQMFGAYNQYLDMPIDIIERIEVVRGPGSLLNYVNAYAGSIHVITKANKDDGSDKEKSLFTAFGSDKYVMGGFLASYKEGGFELSSDLFYQQHDKSVDVRIDRLGNGGEAPQELKNYALGLNAKYQGLTLKSRFAKNESGISYGQPFSLSEDPTDYLDVSNNFLEIDYTFEFAKDIKGNFSLGYFDETRELKDKVFPDGFMLMMPPPGIILPDGRYFLVDYKEHTFTERFETVFTNFKDHTIITGIQLSQSRVKKDIASLSDDGLQSFTINDLLSTSKRDKVSVYADDLIEFDEKNALQVGAKFDHFNDVSNQFSPRIAYVHRYDDDNIFKLMYTHSFREPSWREEYLVGQHFFRSSDSQAEAVEAYEASYILRFADTDSIKFNAYYLDNKHQIHALDPTRTFQNSGNGHLYGYEVELKTEVASSDQFYLNYSYVDGDNVSGLLTNTAQHIAKSYYVHTFNTALSLSTLLKYVGEKERINNDLREVVDDYMTLDLSAVYEHKRSGLTLTASVKNLFDTKYYLPSPIGTYPDDFEQEGLNYLLRLEKRF